MFLDPAIVATPDQLSQLIAALSPGGPIVVAVGVVAYSVIGAVRDRRDQKATDEVIVHVQARDAELKCLREDVDRLKAAEAARSKIEKEAADRAAMREVVREELDARSSGPNARTTGDFATSPPTSPGVVR